MTTPPVKHLPTKEVGKLLSISDEQVKGLIFKGLLPAINVGKEGRDFWRVSVSDLDAFIEKQRTETARRFGKSA